MGAMIRQIRHLLSQPWMGLGLRCAVGVVVGALLTGCSALELPVPVALAYLASLEFGVEAVCTYVGAAAGYLLLWETVDVVEPLAAGFLILSGLGIFRGLLPAEQRWFRSAAVCAIYALVGLILLLQGPMQPFEIAFFFVKLGVLAGFTAGFCGKGQRRALLLALIGGCTRLRLPGGLPLGAAVAAGAVCRALGGAEYLYAAAACGLALDLCWQPMLSATLVFTASALAAHAAPLRTRAGKTLLFVCGCAVCVLLSGGLEPGLFLMTLAGGFVSCFLPRGAQMPDREESGEYAAAGAVLEELAQGMTRPEARRSGAEASRAERQYQARAAELRKIVAEQYRALGRLLEHAPERAEARVVYRAEVSARTRGRERGASGDRVTQFSCGQWLYVLLCDGMGTGVEAAREAEEAAGLLRRMIGSGFDAQDALQMLNAHYLLRGDGGFSTVDLAQLSLVTGEGFLHKWGAAPSYLRGRDGIRKIGTTSPPPGLGVGETHGAECVRLSMQEGQMLVLVSDGVAEQTALRALRSEGTPSALAAGIVNRGSAEEPDDRSAAAIRLHPVLSWHKHSTKPLRILSKLGQNLYI